MVKYLKAIPEKVLLANLSFENDKQPLVISKTCLLKLFSKGPVTGCLADKVGIEVHLKFFRFFGCGFI